MISTVFIVVIAYVVLSFIVTYLVHQLPRRPVRQRPDWGKVEDLTIPAAEGGRLEVWRVRPEGESRGTVVLAHGWGRNRDRMVRRAAIFGRWGYTTVMHSARDHGGSSRRRWMNGFRFGEDVAAVLQWLDEPVILYGHSAGSAGAVTAAAWHPDQVRTLILESSYADTKPALLSLYRSFNPVFGAFFGRAIVWWMDHVLYRGRMDNESPMNLARQVPCPVLLVHGEKDPVFSVDCARLLASRFAGTPVQLWIAPGAGHSDPSFAPGYEQRLGQFLNACGWPAD